MERTDSKDLRFLSQKLRKIFADGTPKFAKKKLQFSHGTVYEIFQVNRHLKNYMLPVHNGNLTS